MDYIYEILEVGKYIILALAIIGLIVIIIGAYKGNREQIVGGLLTIGAAIIIGLCGYIMYKQTENRVNTFIDEKMEEYYY